MKVFERVYCFVTDGEADAYGNIMHTKPVVSDIITMDCGTSPKGNVDKQIEAYYMSNFANAGAKDLWPKYAFTFKTCPTGYVINLMLRRLALLVGGIYF